MNLNEISLIYYGTVKDGLLKIHARKQFDKDIIMFEGKEIELVLRKKKKFRSNQQNRFYHGAIIPIIRMALRETGIIMNHDQCHELLKERCNQVEYVNEKTGQIIQCSGSTRDLSTSGFMDYLVNIKVWAREFLNIELPEPGEPLHFEFENITIKWSSS